MMHVTKAVSLAAALFAQATPAGQPTTLPELPEPVKAEIGRRSSALDPMIRFDKADWWVANALLTKHLTHAESLLPKGQTVTARVVFNSSGAQPVDGAPLATQTLRLIFAQTEQNLLNATPPIDRLRAQEVAKALTVKSLDRAVSATREFFPLLPCSTSQDLRLRFKSEDPAVRFNSSDWGKFNTSVLAYLQHAESLVVSGSLPLREVRGFTGEGLSDSRLGVMYLKYAGAQTFANLVNSEIPPTQAQEVVDGWIEKVYREGVNATGKE